MRRSRRWRSTTIKGATNDSVDGLPRYWKIWGKRTGKNSQKIRTRSMRRCAVMVARWMRRRKLATEQTDAGQPLSVRHSQSPVVSQRPDQQLDLIFISLSFYGKLNSAHIWLHLSDAGGGEVRCECMIVPPHYVAETYYDWPKPLGLWGCMLYVQCLRQIICVNSKFILTVLNYI